MAKRYVCGLGNPGKKYAATRHNIGWMVLDGLAQALSASSPGPKHEAQAAEAQVGGLRVFLIYPQTFMNLSGDCLAEWARREGMQPESELLIIYDDMDLAPGRLRLRFEGSAGSHNGMGSVVERLGTTKIARLRLGVGKPADPALWADYVLTRFGADEADAVKAALSRAVVACRLWLEGGEQGVLMSKVNAP